MSAAAALRRSWERYWFVPAPLVDLAVCRIAVTGFHLFVMLAPYALLKYPVYGMLDHYAALPDTQWGPEPLAMRALLAPLGGARPDLALTQRVLWLTIAAGGLALVGWRTRTACALFALGNVFLSAYSYSFGEHHHTEAITVMFLLALPFAPCGAALSVDAALARRRAGAGAAGAVGPAAPGGPGALSDQARWPLLFVQWMFALCYLSAAVCKLAASGLAWLNGYTLQYYMLQDGLRWETGIGPWMAGQHGLSVALSWFSILVEGAFCLVLVRPRAAAVLVPAAIALHLGVYATMRAPFLMYLPLYAVFVPWSRLAERKAGRAPFRCYHPPP